MADGVCRKVCVRRGTKIPECVEAILAHHAQLAHDADTDNEGDDVHKTARHCGVVAATVKRILQRQARQNNSSTPVPRTRGGFRAANTIVDARRALRIASLYASLSNAGGGGRHRRLRDFSERFQQTYGEGHRMSLQTLFKVLQRIGGGLGGSGLNSTFSERYGTLFEAQSFVSQEKGESIAIFLRANRSRRVGVQFCAWGSGQVPDVDDLKACGWSVALKSDDVWTLCWEPHYVLNHRLRTSRRRVAQSPALLQHFLRQTSLLVPMMQRVILCENVARAFAAAPVAEEAQEEEKFKDEQILTNRETLRLRLSSGTARDLYPEMSTESGSIVDSESFVVVHVQTDDATPDRFIFVRIGADDDVAALKECFTKEFQFLSVTIEKPIEDEDYDLTFRRVKWSRKGSWMHAWALQELGVSVVYAPRIRRIELDINSTDLNGNNPVNQEVKTAIKQVLNDPTKRNVRDDLLHQMRTHYPAHSFTVDLASRRDEFNVTDAMCILLDSEYAAASGDNNTCDPSRTEPICMLANGMTVARSHDPRHLPPSLLAVGSAVRTLLLLWATLVEAGYKDPPVKVLYAFTIGMDSATKKQWESLCNLLVSNGLSNELVVIDEDQDLVVPDAFEDRQGEHVSLQDNDVVLPFVPLPDASGLPSNGKALPGEDWPRGSYATVEDEGVVFNVPFAAVQARLRRMRQIARDVLVPGVMLPWLVAPRATNVDARTVVPILRWQPLPLKADDCRWPGYPLQTDVPDRDVYYKNRRQSGGENDDTIAMGAPLCPFSPDNSRFWVATPLDDLTVEQKAVIKRKDCLLKDGDPNQQAWWCSGAPSGVIVDRVSACDAYGRVCFELSAYARACVGKVDFDTLQGEALRSFVARRLGSLEATDERKQLLSAWRGSIGDAAAQSAHEALKARVLPNALVLFDGVEPEDAVLRACGLALLQDNDANDATAAIHDEHARALVETLHDKEENSQEWRDALESVATSVRSSARVRRALDLARSGDLTQIKEAGAKLVRATSSDPAPGGNDMQRRRIVDRDDPCWRQPWNAYLYKKRVR